MPPTVTIPSRATSCTPRECSRAVVESLPADPSTRLTVLAPSRICQLDDLPGTAFLHEQEVVDAAVIEPGAHEELVVRPHRRERPVDQGSHVRELLVEDFRARATERLQPTVDRFLDPCPWIPRVNGDHSRLWMELPAHEGSVRRFHPVDHRVHHRHDLRISGFWRLRIEPRTTDHRRDHRTRNPSH